jgi:predicted GNAT family acetyltransferase
MNVFTEPTLEHFEELKKWLKEEDKLYNEGFFCQIHTIEKSFQNRKLIVITDNGLTVGFLTYYYHNYIVNIEIAEVKPDSRGKGFGRLLLNHSFNWFVKNDALVRNCFVLQQVRRKFGKEWVLQIFPMKL